MAKSVKSQYVIKRIDYSAFSGYQIVTNYYSLGGEVNYKWNPDKFVLSLELGSADTVLVEIIKILPGGAGFTIPFNKTYPLADWSVCLKDLVEALLKEEQFATKSLLETEPSPALVSQQGGLYAIT